MISRSSYAPVSLFSYSRSFHQYFGYKNAAVNFSNSGVYVITYLPICRIFRLINAAIPFEVWLYSTKRQLQLSFTKMRPASTQLHEKGF